MTRVDLLVVGGGTAGLVGARTAAGFGASVLLVERERTGGDCLNTGCVPSKALLAAAAAAADARAAGRLGVRVTGVEVDAAAVLAHVKGAIATIAPVDSPEALRAAGVAVRHAGARFTGPATADVGGEEVVFGSALIATGSDPQVPPIPGLREAGPLTSDTVWDLDAFPRRLAVLGGGSIGCELGQAFARLGSAVTLVEAAPRLLPAEDPDAAALVAAALRRDGVVLHTGVAVAAADAGGVDLADGRRVDADALLVALGRVPDTRGLGLDAAGVAVDGRGFVRVDRALRTANPRVWAAGDVTGHPPFTHLAGVHGSTAATNAVLGLRRRAEDPAVVPRVTYTFPEVAAVGARDGHHVRTVPLTAVDRAVADGRTEGFSRLVLDRRGRVRGATVVGPRAGEALGELTLAVRSGLRARDLAGTVHPYPTYANGPWDAAIADVRARLAARPARLVTALLRGARRRRAAGTGSPQRRAR